MKQTTGCYRTQLSIPYCTHQISQRRFLCSVVIKYLVLHAGFSGAYDGHYTANYRTHCRKCSGAYASYHNSCYQKGHSQGGDILSTPAPHALSQRYDPPSGTIVHAMVRTLTPQYSAAMGASAQPRGWTRTTCHNQLAIHMHTLSSSHVVPTIRKRYP